MKIVDKLLIKNFVGPFLLTFFLTLFIFVMQFLWKYIDDLVGKGLETELVVELILYASASFVPLSLPLAILFASIMTYGNLGETYELVAFKSSGMSLFRLMRGLLIIVMFIGAGAFYFNNTLLPQANKKFASLLYDITKQKPALNIKPGVFYNDIKGYSIFVKEKSADNKEIFDVMIYDHTEDQGNNNVLLAERGEMLMTSDSRYLIIRLFNGKRYNEKGPASDGKGEELYRTYFDVWEKYFDLAQFDLQETDERLWNNHYKMLNLLELNKSIKKINGDKAHRVTEMQKNYQRYFFEGRFEVDSLSSSKVPLCCSPGDGDTIRAWDSLRYNGEQKIWDAFADQSGFRSTLQSFFEAGIAVPKDSSLIDWIYGQKDKTSRFLCPQAYAYYELNGPVSDQDMLGFTRRAMSQSKNIKSFTGVTMRDMAHREKVLIKHWIEWHLKFTISVACLVLFFIGAPLGAIIRKGGFGWPLGISALFFIFYHVLNIVGRKVAENGVWTPMEGVWLSTVLLLPIGIFLTLKAKNDSPLVNTESYKLFFKRLFNFSSKSKEK